MAYFVYLVRCEDATLYCGITTDLIRRLSEHNTSVRGAKYIRARRPVTLVYYRKCRNRGFALRYEAKVKSMTKQKKEQLVADFQQSLTK